MVQIFLADNLGMLLIQIVLMFRADYRGKIMDKNYINVPNG